MSAPEDDDVIVTAVGRVSATKVAELLVLVPEISPSPNTAALLMFHVVATIAQAGGGDRERFTEIAGEMWDAGDALGLSEQINEAMDRLRKEAMH